jgi:hypothetical protein
MSYQKYNQNTWSRLPAQATNTKSEEYNLDDEDLSDCVSTITRDRKESRPHRGRCPRCGGKSKLNTQFPYCMDCNWDSLHDPSWNHYE